MSNYVNIVFDANFFICMNSIRAKNLLANLETAGKNLDYDYFISQQVFEEIKGVNQAYRDKFHKFINVEEIQSNAVESIKNRLKKHNIRFPAQDPDLSLVALCQRILKEEKDAEIHLVSDDFKLAKNVNLLYQNKINILSLSSFLLKIQRTTSITSLKKYFNAIWRKSLNYTLSYMIERSKIYPAEEKITWLIERAITVTESSIVTKDTLSDGQAVCLGPADESLSNECEIAEKYIQGNDLPKSEAEQIEGVLTFLENLRISRDYLIHAKNALIDDNVKDSVRYLKRGSSFLTSLLQLAHGKVTGKNYDILEQLICSELSKIEFLRAFLLLSIGRVNPAIEALDRTALYSTIVHNWRTSLTINYLKALIRVFHGFYNPAIKQYDFTYQLAETYNENKLMLKCTIGKALALFLENPENKNQAISIMEEISELKIEENLEDGMIVFSELGDYFLALGHSQIAISLYDASLEMAVDGNFEYKISTLIEKLKRAYIATILSGYSTETINVDILFNKAYKLKNVEKYNEQIKGYQDFNRLFYTPFPHTTGKKIVSYQNINKGLKDYFEVVKVERMEKNKTLFVAFHTELGLLGFLVFGAYDLSGVAENYSLKLKETAKIRVYNPNSELKDTYLIRAIVEIKDKEYIDVIYNLPVFFKQMNI